MHNLKLSLIALCLTATVVSGCKEPTLQERLVGNWVYVDYSVEGVPEDMLAKVAGEMKAVNSMQLSFGAVGNYTLIVELVKADRPKVITVKGSLDGIYMTDEDKKNPDNKIAFTKDRLSLINLRASSKLHFQRADY